MIQLQLENLTLKLKNQLQIATRMQLEKLPGATMMRLIG
jgi:hypothetical protein